MSAVEVEEGKLLYGEWQALGLRDVSLTVRRGTIYALLGPSGCGKTTLLSTLVGLKTLQAGRVKVLGHEVGVKGSGVPGPWIGYMPQDLCLYSELTSEETLRYFASLHRISGPQVLERTQFLLDLLDLPRRRLTSELSGGQQRLLSLATALVHDPPLLLLDEPTVGVDPLLRKTIWSHLCHLSRELGKTVLITTHYIEEAGRADVVGFMRDGKMLTEADPRSLMERSRVSTLEEVFLRFCLKMEDGGTSSTRNGRRQLTSTASGGVLNNGFESDCREIDKMDSGDCSDVEEIGSTSSLRVECDSELDIRLNNLSRSLPKLNTTFLDFCAVVLAIVLKNMLIIRRNIMFLILAFASPLSNVLLAKLLVAHEPFGLKVALVNNESPALMSHKIIIHLNRNTLDLRPYNSLDEAKRHLRYAEVQAVLHIGPNFTRSVLKRAQQGLSADNVTVAGSTLRMNSFFINLEVDRTILIAVFDAYAKTIGEYIENFGAEPGVAKSPLVFEKPVLGSEKPNLTDFIVINLLPDSLYMMSLALSVLVFVGERNSGLFDRSRVSGVVPLQSMITLVQIVLLLLFLLSFRMEVKGSYILLVFLFYQASYFGMSIGIFISAITKTPHTALISTIFIYWCSVCVSGTLWPTESFPAVFREIFQVHPNNWNYRAVSKVVLNGIGWSHVTVWRSVLLTSGSTILVLVGAVLLVNRRI